MVCLVDPQRIAASLLDSSASIHQDELSHLGVRQISERDPDIQNGVFKILRTNGRFTARGLTSPALRCRTASVSV